MDWSDWHRHYGTSLALLTRLRIVREQIKASLSQCGPGPIRIVSICAGDGRDVIEALSDDPRRGDATAWLLDTDAPSLDRGKVEAAAAGLEHQIQFLCRDATLADSYRGMVPADLIIASGVLGHLGNPGTRYFLENLRMLCKTGGSVIWNRHLVVNEGARDVLVIREDLRSLDFEEAHYSVTSQDGFAVGRSRFRGLPAALDAERKMFEFIGLDQLSQSNPATDEPTQRQTSDLFVSDLTASGPVMSKFDFEQSLASCFERRAALHPHRMALGSGSWQPSYGELNAAANRLAHAMITQAGSCGDRVILLMGHDTPLIAAMIAVLKAGGIVVVLNATDPEARLTKVLHDAAPAHLLTDSAHEELSVRIAGGHCVVHRVEDYLVGAPAPNPEVSVSLEDIAFLVYTSGSTGPPKGVMQSHRHILHKVFRISGSLALRESDKVLLLASLSGGQGVNTTWCALAGGATLCPFPAMTLGVTGLADWMTAHGITILVAATSVLRHFAKTLDETTRLHGTRLVWLASEPVTSGDFASFQRHFAEDCILIHTLASSETGVIARLRLTGRDPVPGERLPVGQPVQDVEVILLDEQGREVPPGETGEIAIRSRYLFSGYWRDDDLTAQRLSGDRGSDSVKLFRTGDRGRQTADGQLSFMGRLDTRVNVHGYRVELSEIEEALSQEPSVERAAVSACTRPSGDVQLVAHVTLRPGHSITGDLLRQALRAVLPGHMIPSAFVFLETIPLTPHGKMDREALRRIMPESHGQASVDHPYTDTEKLIADLWSDAFEYRPISLQDNFFDLGGDSLTAAVMAARIYAALRVQLDLRLFAEHPTLASLAFAVDAMRVSHPPESSLPLVRVSRDGPLPLSFHQERTWRFSQTPEGAAGYIAAGRHLIRGPLDPARLRESMSFLAIRHEALRTTFAEVEGNPVQRVHSPVPEPLPLINLASASDPEEQAARIFRDEAGRPLDLARLPLMRFILIRLRGDEHLLLRIGHHIIVDAWSWDIYFSELGLVYEAKLRGESPPLPEFEPLQYADYAVWQRRVMGPETVAYQEGLSWWASHLAEPPLPVEPPFRRPMPMQNVDPAEGSFSLDVDAAISGRLNQIARELRATYFVARLAAFTALMADETKQPDVILGTYATNRNQVETQRMFGFFANMITLRFSCDVRLTFREWIAMVGVLVSEFQARAEIPYEHLCDELRGRGTSPPEIRLIFSTIEQMDALSFGGLSLTKLVPRPASMPWGFTLLFSRSTAGERCSAKFDANLYDPAGVGGFVGRLIRFLDAASRQPDWPLDRLLMECPTAAPASESPGSLAS